MSLAAPIALALVLLAAPILWSFLARRRAPKKVVGSVILMRAALARARTRVVAPKIRHPIALALTLLALFAGVLGLAGPQCGASAGGDLIVVVDGSASMGREGAGGTRLEVGRRGLESSLQALGRHQHAALIVASATPRVEVGRTLDATAVTQALEGLAPGGQADVAAALELADSLCFDPGRDSIVLVSDGDAGPLPELACPISRVPIPAGGEDMGITALAARRADGLGLFEVVLGVSSSEGPDRAVEVELRVDGQLVDSASLDVPGGGTAWSVRRLDAPGRVLEAHLLDIDDADPSNDVAYAVRAEVPPVRVGLVSDMPEGFLAVALSLHPAVDLEIRPPDAAGELAGVDLLVLEARPDALPPSSRAVAFGPDAAAALGLQIGGLLETPRVTRWAFDAELLRLVDLDGLMVVEARGLQVPGDGGALLELDGVPVLVHGTSASRPIVAAGFAPEASDLVLRIGFLHLIANLVEWASPNEAEPATAEVGRVWPGARADELLVTGDGAQTPAWRPVPRAGLLDIWAGDTVRSRVAARPAGPGEVVPGPVAATPVPVSASSGAGGLPWWVWAVALGLALLGLETALGAGLAWWSRLTRGAP